MKGLSTAVSGILFLCCQLNFTSNVFSQGCPGSEAAFAAGGTFSGNCTLNIGGAMTITGAIVWQSGTLTINDSGPGGNGDVTINSTGSITVQGGTIQVADGFLTINSGASVNVQSGATLELATFPRDITVNGTLTNSGTVSTQDDIRGSGTITNSGSLSTADDLVFSGTIDNSGTVSVSDDITVTGTFNSTGGSITADDMFINSGGDFNLSGGTLNMNDNITVDGSGSSLNVTGTGSINDVDYLTIQNGASGEIGSGASVYIQDNLTLDDGNMTISGTMINTSAFGGDRDIEMDGASNLIINSPANVSVEDIDFGNDGASTITVNGGTLDVTDDIKFNGSNDGDAIVVNGGTINVADDLNASGSNATITVNSGGTVNANEVNGSQPTNPASLPSNIAISGGNFNVNGVTLPVELLYFRAATAFDELKLEWATANEIDNKGFFIEKSEDGLDFEAIGFVEGNGDSKELIEYSFDLPSNEYGFYRLKQVDFDGDYEFSSIVILEVPANSSMITVYPNPVQHELRLNGDQTVIQQIAIYSLSGKVLLRMEGTLPDCEAEVSKAILSQPKGTYILKISSPDDQYTIPVIKN